MKRITKQIWTRHLFGSGIGREHLSEIQSVRSSRRSQCEQGYDQPVTNFELKEEKHMNNQTSILPKSRLARFAMVAVLLSLILGGSGVGYADETCFSEYISGSGPTLMDICISDTGNLVKFVSPPGFEQVDISTGETTPDGYAICSGSIPGSWDRGFDSANFNSPTVIQPHGSNTFPLTIIRDTTDGRFRLTQNFSQDVPDLQVSITMKVTRLSIADCSPNCATTPVILSRYFQGGVDNAVNAATGYTDRTADSVWVDVENLAGCGGLCNGGHGLMLTGRPNSSGPFTTAHLILNADPAGCVPVFSGQLTTPTNPPNNNNFANYVAVRGLVGYDAALPKVGSSMTGTVVYKRF